MIKFGSDYPRERLSLSFKPLILETPTHRRAKTEDIDFLILERHKGFPLIVFILVLIVFTLVLIVSTLVLVVSTLVSLSLLVFLFTLVPCWLVRSLLST